MFDQLSALYPYRNITSNRTENICPSMCTMTKAFATDIEL